MKLLSSLAIVVLLALSFISGASAQSRLRAGDSVAISISGVPMDEQAQFNKEYSVDADGNVNLPYINRVRAVGLTTAALQSSIEAVYRGQDIYTHPTITITNSAGQAPRFVSVGGQVNSQTRVPYTEDMTLMDAISAAGGFTPFARKSDVQLFRDGSMQKINVERIEKGESGNIPLKPGDRINVNERFL